MLSSQQTGRLIALASLATLVALAGCSRGQSNVAQAALLDPPEPKPGRSLPAAPTCKDASSALRQMVAAYKALDSFYSESDTEMSTSFLDPSIMQQTSILAYRRDPAGLMLTVRDPATGTQRFYADGSSMVHHFGMSNQFIRRDVRGDLQRICQAVDHEAPAYLNPVALLRDGATPMGVAEGRLVGQETVGSRQAYVIKGAFSRAWMAETAQRVFANPLEPVRGEFTLWLDTASCLQIRSDVHLEWKGRIKVSETVTKPFAPRVDARTRVTKLIQNPALPGDMFRFVAPQGASQVFVESTSQMR